MLCRKINSNASAQHDHTHTVAMKVNDSRRRLGTAVKMKSDGTQQSVIVAVDVGSSSIRCSAYDATNYNVVASSSQQRRSVHPGTGRIILMDDTSGESLLDVIDGCVDDVLRQLLQGEYKVTAIGFSTFVMNLVGVDRHGHLVGDEATLSYACQTAEVNAEVEDLKW
jgi:gluconokinase